MQYLLEFLNENTKDSKVALSLNCSDAQLEILKHLSMSYTTGVSSMSVYDALSAIFGNENLSHIEHLKDVKNLLDAGWITLVFGVFKQERSNNSLLSMLYADISLSQNFLKLLEEGGIEISLPTPSAYKEHFEYLKDQFARIELYERKALLNSNSEAKKHIDNQIKIYEKFIKERLGLSKISLKIEQIFKENSLNDKEQILFLALLKQEYTNSDTNMRELENLASLVGDDEIERVNARAFLSDGAKLLENSLIEYDEVLNGFDNITQSFFIVEEILQEIMHSQSTKSDSRLKLESIVKEQEIFELIEPKTNINDVVLNENTKELLSQILKQVDKRVLSRLNSWGIKSRKGIDAKIIFYGEPGTGKTMSALSLAKSLKKQVLSFDCSKILSKYVGESEQNVRKIFDSYKEICKKSKTEPVLLLNEADQFLSTRIEGGSGAEKMHNQMQNIFLEQIERFEGVLIATTNFLQSLDSAFSRRFDYKIEFKKPDFKARLAIWRNVLPQSASFEDGFDLEKLAQYNLSGAQIVLVLKNTALRVATKDDGIFTLADFKASIERELSSAFGDEKKVGLL
ncbi:ATPase AAA [Campylobacter mucosalis]|uniref:ATP-binding protein n=1 Tax=Campylobacter mucosalis TaxID=202 RepID=UPI0004D769B2|nr:ATP-binding protein [Campylobacter mucosalis]KEA45444.1 ATPase AAA [Campylobacter mucosalis]QKF63776.1 ATP-binding protein (AAA domain) [Campylobacter mucosalis]